ncbi:MAG: transposase [Bacteroidota bacterium]
MTIYGVDPSADSFTADTFPPTGATDYPNTPDGLAAFCAALPDESLVGVENTGVYSELLCYALHHAGVAVMLLDPGAVHRAFPPGPKTDALDSARIAEYAHRYADRLARWQPRAEVVEQVRVLLATPPTTGGWEHLVGQRTAALNARSALRRKVVQTPGANAALDAVAAALREQVGAIEAELRRLIGAHPSLAQGVSLLVGIPGVGLLLASQMVVLTEGFTDVPPARRLASRLGIAPHPHRSGTSVRRPDRSRGYGHPAVRKLLHLAARSRRTHDAASRGYFEAKVGAGKAARLVLNNLSNRLVAVMCAVLRDGVPYRSDHVSVAPMVLTGHRQSG